MAVIEFPPNKTLYVDQFTDTAPTIDEERQGLKARNIDEVFEHYKPCKDSIVLKSANGEVVVENFVFRKIEDFEDEPLIAQSETLSIEKATIDIYNSMIRQCERNKALREVLENGVYCEHFQKALKAMLAELNNDNGAEMDNLGQSLQESLAGLDKIGGFSLFEDLMEGIENMNPSHSVVKDLFISDITYTGIRKHLQKELSLWIEALVSDANPSSVIDFCKNKCETIESHLADNLSTVHDAARNLEITYRGLDAFFKNAGQGDVECLTLMNVNKERLGINDSDDNKAVCRELGQYYDRLSLKESYSLFVVPGYVEEANVVCQWAQVAHKNKVLMITDFKDINDFETLKDELGTFNRQLIETANRQDLETCLTNVIMTCNYLLGRRKSEIANEDDDLYIPGSPALAGRMTNLKEIAISQGVAGRQYGTLKVKGVRLEMSRSEMSVVISQNVIPIIEENGRATAFSNLSLYKGFSGLQEYPVVRVFDWIGKVLQNFFNGVAFINWDTQVKRGLEQAVQQFLNDYKYSGRIIENYSLQGIHQDPTTRNITISVKLKPFFAARNFLLELTGHKNNNCVDWIQKIS